MTCARVLRCVLKLQKMVASSEDEETLRRVPLTLTHVLYEEGDLLGYVLAWFSLLPIFILVGLGTLILVRRDLQTMFFTAGLVINEGINFILKHLIQQSRPENNIHPRHLFGKYGMPSSHAQFVGCFATYFSLFVFVRVLLSTGVCDYIWKTVCSGVAILGSLLCCVSRLYLGYHTLSQVVYGILSGVCVAILWFVLVQVIFEPYFSQIYQWKVSELFLVKDMSRIPNYLWFEYTSVRQETKKRLRRKSS